MNSSGGGIARGSQQAGSGTNAVGGPAAHANIHPRRSASKYEVRDQRGKLLGMISGIGVVPNSGVVLSCMPKPLSYRSGVLAMILDVKQVVLREERVTWTDGSQIPTLVLCNGKPSWLKGVKGFWRT